MTYQNERRPIPHSNPYAVHGIDYALCDVDIDSPLCGTRVRRPPPGPTLACQTLIILQKELPKLTVQSELITPELALVL